MADDDLMTQVVLQLQTQLVQMGKKVESLESDIKKIVTQQELMASNNGQQVLKNLVTRQATELAQVKADNQMITEAMKQMQDQMNQLTSAVNKMNK